MANFNKVKQNNPKDVSYENGAVYKKSSVDAWMNMLFSSFMEDQFYESSQKQQKRFIELTQEMCDQFGPIFVAKAAVFARNELGMRSISQLVAAWLNTQSFETKRAFYRAFMHRPDDVAEIFAAVDFLGQKRSHALVRGSADYLSSLRPQLLAKYKLNSRTYNMYDLINITHANSGAINQYKAGMLENAETWEVKISGASSKEERQQEWKNLVENHKLGYMALIRNLNNILDVENIDQTWIDTYLIPQIVASNDIKKSLMFPYRFYTAYKNLRVFNTAIVDALGKAFSISAQNNAPKLNGSSGIILDVSGSMDSPVSSKSKITIKQIGACFAVSLFFTNPNCKIIKFGNDAKEVKLNKLDNPFLMIEQICANDHCGYGTEIGSAFDLMNEINDGIKRMFIISDMQVMDGASRYSWFSYDSVSAVRLYHKYFGMLPAYSFDLGNYHTQILSPFDHLHYITALNDQVFKFIGLLESGIDLVGYINSFNYC